MEYKYRMLPAPFSTESIDFKLSQTQLEGFNLMSPVKVHGSLTYTVSMETIQDQDGSPSKFMQQYYLQYMEHLPSCEIHLQSPQKKFLQLYSLNSQQPINSIQIQQPNMLQNKQICQQISLFQGQDVFQKQAIAISLYQESGNKNQSVFVKKSILKVNQLDLLPEKEDKNTIKEKKMGKIMTRIHSQIKQQKTINNLKTSPRNKIISPTNQNKPRVESAKVVQLNNKQNKPMFMLKNSKKKVKINENNLITEKSQEANFIAGKANFSANYSPQLLRRKSDYVINSSCISKRKNKLNQVFYSDRQCQNNQKSILGNLNRQKIYSTLVPRTNSQLVESIQSKEKCVFTRNKQNIKSNRLKSKITNETNLNDSLSIVAIKLSTMQRNNDKNIISSTQKPKYKSLSNYIQNIRLSQKSKRIFKRNGKGKQTEQFPQPNSEVVQPTLIQIVNNKKDSTKIQDYMPKKLFCY